MSRAALGLSVLAAGRGSLWPAYVCESLASVGTTLLTIGIFFYTQRYFGWGLRENFLLASAQGAVYTVGALLAEPVASRFGRRRGLIVIYLMMCGIAVAAMAAPRPGVLVTLLLAYTLVAAANWPALESLVATGAGAHEMSRRMGDYNLVWSATNTVTLAVSGTIIQGSRAGLFVLPAAAHLVSALLMWARSDVEAEPAATSGKAAVEAQLLAQRTLAMWLARISLPATYVVIYSMMAMMPSLALVQTLSTAGRTVVGSVWMGARLAAFVVLGATVWWHTRPRILLWAAVGMLIAFLGVTVPMSRWAGMRAPWAAELSAMIAWQVVLGAVMGVIYSASLYFGMVLSEGSTEHGGYHEALIGLGSVLGPGAGALAQWVAPGNSNAGIAAVAGVIAVSVGVAAIAGARKGGADR